MKKTSIKTYEWILFDADETLFHFDAFSGLKLTFSRFNIVFTPEDYQAYQTVNQLLWVAYQNGDINSQQLQQQRFANWADKLQVSAADLNSSFMRAMAEICTPVAGAADLLQALQGKVKLGIITNGFTELQQKRLEHTGFQHYFDLLVISEQVGFAKPHPDIFAYALTNMGSPDRDRVLMVGDNPDSDILGGINAGLDTCWFNIAAKPAPEGIAPTFQVASLSELQCLLEV